jgi:hypothetical protein
LSGLGATRGKDGALAVTGIPPLLAEVVRELPELFALLADSKRIVEHDLASLAKAKRGPMWRLEIPAAHVTAWISALNAARLALGALFDVTADDMHPDREPTYDERGLAILRIDLFAWLQGTLIDAVSSAE